MAKEVLKFKQKKKKTTQLKNKEKKKIQQQKHRARYWRRRRRSVKKHLWSCFITIFVSLKRLTLFMYHKVLMNEPANEQTMTKNVQQNNENPLWILFSFLFVLFFFNCCCEATSINCEATDGNSYTNNSSNNNMKNINMQKISQTTIIWWTKKKKAAATAKTTKTIQ